jgi:potassium efflux system protein
MRPSTTARPTRRGDLDPHRLRLVIFVFLIGFALPSFAEAQQPSSPATSAPATPTASGQPAAEPPKPDPLPASQILEGMQKAQSRLQELDADTTEAHATVEVQDALPAFEKDINGNAGTDLVLLEGGVIPDRLMDIEISWSKRQLVLKEWNEALSQRIQQLSGYVEELKGQKERWAKAQEDGKAQALAPSVMDRLSDLQESLSRIDERARTRQNIVLTLQDRVVSVQGVVVAVLKEVEKVRQAQREQLLALDSPPLWTSLARVRSGDTPPTMPLASALRVSIDYFESREGRTAAFLCFIAFVAILVSAIGSAAHRWVGDDSGSEALTAALSRPIAGGTLVGLLVFPWVYPERPMIVGGLVSVLAVFPMIRLLTPLVGDSVRKVIYVVSLWVVVNLLREYLVAAPTLNRLILLAETLVVLGGIAWLIRPARLVELERPGIGMRFLGVGARVAGLVLIVSIGANVVGNVTLANLLAGGLLNSIYFGIVLYGALQVMEAIYYVLLRTPAANKLRMVERHGALLRRRGMRILGLGIIIFWVSIVLRQFGIQGVVFDWVGVSLSAKFVAGGLEVSLGDVLGFVLTLWLSMLIARLLRFALEEDILPRTRLARGVPHTISLLLSYSVVLLGFIVAVAVAGIDMGRFALMVSALGVGIGIGLQDVVNNFVSGLILLFERPIQVGDTVELTECQGMIKRIGLRSSTVRTWDGAEVIIPNSRFVTNEFTNWTLSDPQRRMHIPVGVEYGTEPERVLEILMRVATENPEVMETPEPAALFTGFGDSSLDFLLRAWTESNSWRKTMSDMSIEIHHALAEADITVPFPQRDLHLMNVPDGMFDRKGSDREGGPTSER